MKRDIRNSSSAGFYLVLVALGISVLLSLAGAIVSLGFLTSGQARLQSIANLAALSALEGYVESPSNDYVTKADAARQKASDMLESNRIPGMEAHLGTLRHRGQVFSGSIGELILGNWYREQPPAGNPCGNYPCFVENPDVSTPPPSGTTANAARIVMDTGNVNLLNVPFCRVLGACDQSLKTSATTSMVQRCTAYIMDVSLSTFSETHHYSPNAFEPLRTDLEDDCDWCSNHPSQHFHPHIFFQKMGLHCVRQLPPVCPYYYPGAFVLDASSVELAEGGQADVADHKGEFCGGATPADVQANYHAGIYCNMPAHRSDPEDPRVFRSDYERHTYYIGTTPHDVYVDEHTLPEPFASFLLAFNAGLRLVADNKSFSDKAILLAASGEIKGQYPVDPANPHAMATDLGPMIQITNFDNIKKASRIHPNLIDYKFFTQPRPQALPSDFEVNTNIALALRRAAEALSTQCPASAQKTIILASDGLGSCHLPTATGAAVYETTDALLPATYTNCSPTSFDRFWYSANALTGYVAEYLRSRSISVVTLVAGAHIGPSFKNVQEGGSWLSPMDVSRTGSTGRGGWLRRNTSNEWLLDLRRTDPYQSGGGSPNTRETFNHLGLPGVVLRDAAGVLADLSIITGGIYCPLLPECGTIDPNPADGHAPCINTGCGSSADGYCYAPDPSGGCSGDSIVNTSSINDGRRSTSHWQYCSVRKESMAAQAARCVLESLGSNPYVLVSEEAPYTP